MSATKKCIYCISSEASTRDHVPPATLWGGKKDKDMITVPCCEKCRQSQQGDDEYLRTLFSLSIGSDRLESGKRALGKTIREFQYRKNRGKISRSYFKPTLKPYHSMSGEYKGVFPQAEIDAERINRIAWRIHRGLIYHHYQQILSDSDVDFEIQIIGGKTILDKGLEEAQKDLAITNFPGNLTNQIGDGSVVQYQVNRAEDNILGTLSRILFYESVAITCITIPINTK